jgi:hypothetical protein
MPRLVVVFLVLLIGGTAAAQKDSLPDPEVVQFSGLVVTGDSLNPVPLATVYRQRDRRGTVTDFFGFFTLPAFVGDTIVISNVGYQSARFVIPKEVDDQRLQVVQFLKTDTITLSTAQVYPWPHKSKFKQEFMALEVGDNEYERARKNLEAIVMQDGMMAIGTDGSENYKIAMRQQADKLYYEGQAPPLSILNPVAWAQFIQAWRNGDLKR